MTLTNLPAHSQVTVSFDLYIIQSWDGNDSDPNAGPDNWQLTADSNNVFFTNFINFISHESQAYPNQLPPYGAGGSYPRATGSFERGHLGFGTGAFGDATYRLSFTIQHTASSINLKFHGMQNQSAEDEGWGLDNVSVKTVSSTETPTTGRLINISTRSFVGFGMQNQIAGFAVSNGKLKVAARAIGQGLVAAGVPTDLNARIQVYTYPTRNLVAENDDWQSGSSAAELQTRGLNPSHSTDAALILTLDSGLYTVEVSPVNKSGIGLVEVFDVQ